MTRVIDLNADVGESFGRWRLGEDEALLPHLSSANVACGFHAGDPTTIRRTCSLAVAHGVAIGAQVGYRDLAGFGRRFIDVADEDLTADIAYQIGALAALARAEGGVVGYVKPHGALYHAMWTSQGQAHALAAAVAAVDPGLAVVVAPGSHLDGTGLRLVHEGFADRRYDEDGRVVDRRSPGALITGADEAAAAAVSLAGGGTVRTICVHGDTPGAPQLAEAVRAGLTAAGFSVASFSADLP